ncbi:hypothetical protein AURDEDRAFT_131782 [Auricularia subglabra TFB-10046 SS5]|uniref:Uncharacterized protein n=1 Tax=Auricularia subglabra (strain TFB-10046 / SS5) TaxID=717982 RepID=J0CSJ1_AURST|nr:hypothetical protein AURDEDRAFT_131782 [Auricularia subglabra TFB-10046 SS5]
MHSARARVVPLVMVESMLDRLNEMVKKFAAVDTRILVQFEEKHDAFPDRNGLFPGLMLSASSIRGGRAALYRPRNVLILDDGCWADDGRDRVGRDSIDTLMSSRWARLVAGTSLRYKRSNRLNARAQTRQLCISVTRANAVPRTKLFKALATSWSLFETSTNPELDQGLPQQAA